MAAASQGASAAEDLEEKRAKVQSLMAEMKTWPTEADMMQKALDGVHNTSTTAAERVVSAKLLQELVEQVDLANGVPLLPVVHSCTDSCGCVSKRDTAALPGQDECASADLLRLNTTGSPMVAAAEVIARSLMEGGELRGEMLRVVAVAAANNMPFQRAFLAEQQLFVPWLLQVRPVSGLACRSDQNFPCQRPLAARVKQWGRYDCSCCSTWGKVTSAMPTQPPPHCMRSPASRATFPPPRCSCLAPPQPTVSAPTRRRTR